MSATRASLVERNAASSIFTLTLSSLADCSRQVFIRENRKSQKAKAVVRKWHA
jgi:hypothetical protein